MDKIEKKRKKGAKEEEAERVLKSPVALSGSLWSIHTRDEMLQTRR